MDTHASNRRLWVALGLVLMGVAVALSSAGALYVRQYLQAADYPGAFKMSEHSLYDLAPHPTLRRDTSYRIPDPFPKVYQWYSRRFGLGPEVRAQSACILMDKGSEWLFLRRHTSVTVCDTPTGRMVFVMRSVSLR